MSDTRSTILIIDDDPGLRTMLERALSREADVMTASEASEGIDLFRLGGDNVDLVLLDLGLPGMSGYDALAQLQLIDADVRVVIITGLEADVERLPGIVGVLSKPFRPEQVLAVARDAAG